MSETNAKIEAPGPWSRKRLVLYLPLAIFLGLALLFLSQLGVRDGGDEQRVHADV